MHIQARTDRPAHAATSAVPRQPTSASTVIIRMALASTAVRSSVLCSQTNISMSVKCSTDSAACLCIDALASLPCIHVGISCGCVMDACTSWLLLTSAGEIGSTGYCNGTCCSGVCNYDQTTGHTICCAIDLHMQPLLAWQICDPEPRLTMFKTGFRRVDQALVDPSLLVFMQGR